MTFDLTPAELTALNTTGEARVVRKCRPKPNKVINGVPAREKVHPGGSPIETQYYFDHLAPFPPAGTREAIPDIGPCVWGEGGCKQSWDAVNEHWKEMGLPKRPDEIENPDTYVWVGHIRKEERA